MFIVVCNNTATSKLVHDYIAGYDQSLGDGSVRPVAGKYPLFRNTDPDGVANPRMRTLLIDSMQLDSGEGISPEFRAAAAEEIERVRQERVQRGGQGAGDAPADDAILREVMNTVGRKGQLGEHIRCVVSVSMLTEGWDANSVTHVLGVRAFGKQLLCEQVIGHALRRQSYAVGADGKFKVEYADVFGIPFDFTAQAVKAPPAKPDNLVTVHAISPERDAAEIRFPRVDGYRVDLPQERITAAFDANSRYTLAPSEFGATTTVNSGIVGKTADFTLQHLDATRRSTIIFRIANYVLERHFPDADGRPKLHLFPQVKSIEALPYAHVVVDEAQDISVAQARFLSAIGQGRPNALFFAGDQGQRIFHLLFSWTKLGLDIRGRSHSLKVNYRTSHQIRAAADRLLPTVIADMDGIEEAGAARYRYSMAWCPRSCCPSMKRGSVMRSRRSCGNAWPTEWRWTSWAYWCTDRDNWHARALRRRPPGSGQGAASRSPPCTTPRGWNFAPSP